MVLDDEYFIIIMAASPPFNYLLKPDFSYLYFIMAIYCATWQSLIKISAKTVYLDLIFLFNDRDLN